MGVHLDSMLRFVEEEWGDVCCGDDDHGDDDDDEYKRARLACDANSNVGRQASNE